MKKLIIIIICAMAVNAIHAQDTKPETKALYVIKKPNDQNEVKTYNLILDAVNIISMDILSFNDSQAQYNVQKGTGVVKVTIKPSVQLINSGEVLKEFGISDKYKTLKIRVDGDALVNDDLLADVNAIKSVKVNTTENCIDIISKAGEKSAAERGARKGQMNIH